MLGFYLLVKYISLKIIRIRWNQMQKKTLLKPFPQQM